MSESNVLILQCDVVLKNSTIQSSSKRSRV